MNAVATPRTTKKPRARSPVPESTERPFRGTIRIEGTSAEVIPRTKSTIKAAFDVVRAELDQAAHTDEPHAYAGDSDRLLLIAHDLADEASVRPPAVEKAVDIAHDVGALIRAARLVPGDVESERRALHLKVAALELRWLANAEGTCLIDPGVPRPAAPNRGNGTERDFMEGKALAALMTREGNLRQAASRSNVNASYRDPDEPQDNFTLPFLRLLEREPHLLPGFTAGLSSLLAEVDLSESTVDATAKLSYSACTEHRDADTYETFDAYSAPSLDEQIATFALEDLSTAPLPSNDISSAPVPRVPGADAPAAVRSSNEVIAEVDGVHETAKHVLGEWIDSGSRDSAAYGLMTLVDRIKEMMDGADLDADHSDIYTGLFPTLSVSYLEASHVGRAVIHWAHEDPTLWAVVHLLDHCKHLVDEHVDDLTEAAARKRMSDG